MAESDALLDDPLSKREIQAFYGAAAPVYDGATVEFEAKAKGVALDAMARKPGETYLEVAVGTGNSVVQQVQQTGPEGIVGIDLTPGMLSLTRERLAAARALGPWVLGHRWQLREDLQAGWERVVSRRRRA